MLQTRHTADATPMKHKVKYTVILALAVQLLGSCSNALIKKPESASIDNKMIAYAQVTVRAPTVVFIHGGGPATMHIWAKVYTAVSKNYSVFAYTRYGGGRSSHTRNPQTGIQVVTTLHRLLQQQNIRPPYILVGHSLGGLYANLYARIYPRDTAGLVLLDPTHPRQYARLREQGLEPNRLITKLLQIYKHISPARYSEAALLEQTGKQVLQAGPFPDIPLIVLSAPGRFGNRDENRVYNQLHRELAAMSPQGTYRAVPGGHQIPRTQPEQVIQAIYQVIQGRPNRIQRIQDTRK